MHGEGVTDVNRVVKPSEFVAEEGTAPVPKGDMFATRHDGSVYTYDGTLTGTVFNDVLSWCGDRKASDVVFTTDREILAEIGSEIVPVTVRPLTQAEVENIVRYVYGENGTGQIKAGYDLDPSHEVRVVSGPNRGQLRRYRVNVTAIRIPGSEGMQVTCRTLPTTPPRLEDLSVESDIRDNIRPRDGLVLVTGPTGSGKSTLLAAMIRSIVEKPDAHEKVLEYSAPIEYVYDDVVMPSSSVAQTEVGRQLRPREDSDRRNQSSLFAYATRNALRRKPTIALIGESRDKATIQGTVELSLTGHLVYSTMHVIGVAETLRRAVQPFAGDERDAMAVDIMQSLRMIVTQLLYPRVGGGRVALREYAVFDAGTRALFQKHPVGEWPSFARRLMEERRIVSRRMGDAAYEAFRQGLIDKVTYKRIVASQRDSA